MKIRIKIKKKKPASSRQMAWAARNKAKGLCVICGEKAINSSHCKEHAEKARAWRKAAYKKAKEKDLENV